MSVLLASVALVLILGWVLVGVTMDRRRERARLEKPAELPPPLEPELAGKPVPQKYVGKSVTALLSAECIDPPDLSNIDSVHGLKHELNIACSIDVFIQEESPDSHEYKVLIVRRTATAMKASEILAEASQDPADESKFASTIDDACSKALLDRSGVWEQTVAGWVTDSSMGLADAATFVGNLNVKIHELVADPATAAASAMGFAQAPAEDLGAVMSEYPFPWDGAVARVKRFLEFTGIVLSVATGSPILSCACFKLWAHDEVRHQLAEAARDFFWRPDEELPDPADLENETYRERLRETFEQRNPHDLPDNPDEDDGPYEGPSSL